RRAARWSGHGSQPWCRRKCLRRSKHPMEQTPSAESKPNPEMVSLARESRGLTQIELARKLEVSQGYLSKIESDLLEPSLELVNRLARLLDYPSSFFYLPDRVY